MKSLAKYIATSLSIFLIAAVSAVARSDSKPSRDNFFREVLYAKATSVTPRYDDYTEGSYHVDKLDVLKGIPEAAKKEGLNLRGLIVVGPAGPLWTYHIMAFIEEGEMIRVNSLTMPHARITYKSTGTISSRDYNDFLVRLIQTKVLTTEIPHKGRCDTCPYPEWHYEALISNWSESQARVYYGSLNEPKADADIEAFEKHINSVLSTLKQTYPVKKQSRPKPKRA
jgi:hypothetical protein